MFPTSQAVEIPVNAFAPELTGSKWLAPVRTTITAGPADWLNSPLPFLVAEALPHGASVSAEPQRISDGLPERSRPFELAVNLLSGCTGMAQSTRESRA